MLLTSAIKQIFCNERILFCCVALLSAQASHISSKFCLPYFWNIYSLQQRSQKLCGNVFVLNILALSLKRMANEKLIPECLGIKLMNGQFSFLQEITVFHLTIIFPLCVDKRRNHSLDTTMERHLTYLLHCRWPTVSITNDFSVNTQRPLAVGIEEKRCIVLTLFIHILKCIVT